MAQTQDNVMELVERELQQNPDADVDSLYEAAAEVEPGVRNLTKRQFHARYPLQAKRRMGLFEKKAEEKPRARRRRAAAEAPAEATATEEAPRARVRRRRAAAQDTATAEAQSAAPVSEATGAPTETPEVTPATAGGAARRESVRGLLLQFATDLLEAAEDPSMVPLVRFMSDIDQRARQIEEACGS